MTTSSKATQTINLTVQPLRMLVDEIVGIKVAGCTAGQKVTLHTRSYDNNNEQWESSATFVADICGEVSPNTQKPVAGSYQNIDPRGLFWSMLPIHKKQKDPFMFNKREPIVINISAEIAGRIVGSTSIEMVFSTPDVIRVRVREHGFVGTLCCPAGPGPYPGVLILGGSDGQLCDNQAALLASHGYAALTLAYFGHEGLPDSLVDIPLEYCERALQWLQSQDTVDEMKLAVIGLSRGSELALLLATIFPIIKVVVAGSPSAHLHTGLAHTDYSRPAWTYQNKPLPHLKVKMNVFAGIALLWHALRYQALALRPLYLTTLHDYENLAEATIPVEKIQGAILLISGQDDQIWPASLFAQMLMQRLASYNHPYPYRHLNYQEAGHFVCFPYGYPGLPPLVGSQRGMACGGNAQANAIAIAQSWQEMMIFLHENIHEKYAK